MAEKCIERIQLHLPERLYRDILIEATERDLAASAFIRRVMEKYLYGHRHRPGAERRVGERQK
jgi:hypothetical protein